MSSPIAIEHLCNEAFSVDERDKTGCTALYYAASKDIAELPVKRGADVNAAGGSALTAAIYHHIFHDTQDLVKFLRDCGADVNLPTQPSTLQAAANCGKKNSGITVGQGSSHGHNLTDFMSVNY
jgi:hypothetical protein